jgi:hypothetical protein
MMGFLSSYGILGILGELGTESGSKVFEDWGPVYNPGPK